jgi:AcrR family transcriptional regulator
MLTASQDRRAVKTREALLKAFFDLVVLSTDSYETISAADIAARAGVGRSTLYEHFAGKDAILAASLARPSGTLADAVRAPDNTAALTALLEHFWGNRALARELFTGAMRRHTVAVLVRLVRERLSTERGARWLVPPPLAAIQIAEALLAPVTAWLLGAKECPAARLAHALRQSARALTQTLAGGRLSDRRG